MGLFDGSNKFLVLDKFGDSYTVLFIGNEADADLNLEVFAKLSAGSSVIKKINLKEFKKLSIEDIKHNSKLCETMFGKYFE